MPRHVPCSLKNGKKNIFINQTMKNKKSFLAKASLMFMIIMMSVQSGYPQGSVKNFWLQTRGQSYIKCGSTPINFSRQTFEAWIKIIAFSDGYKHVLFSNGTDCNILVSDSVGFYYIEYEIKAGDTWLKQKSKSPLSANDNSWYHLAAAYDGYSLTIFINGYPLPHSKTNKDNNQRPPHNFFIRFPLSKFPLK